jgi:hypothetical protein
VATVPVGRDPGSGSGDRLFDVVHDVLVEVAPEEVPLLAGLRDVDDAEIGRHLARRSKRDDPLGFGAGEVVVLAAPIIWGAMQQVADNLAVSAAHGLLSRTRALIRRMFRRRTRRAAPLPWFDHDQLREIRAAIREEARKAGMKKARADRLAACVVDRLQFDRPGTDKA